MEESLNRHISRTRNLQYRILIKRGARNEPVPRQPRRSFLANQTWKSPFGVLIVLLFAQRKNTNSTHMVLPPKVCSKRQAVAIQSARECLSEAIEWKEELPKFRKTGAFDVCHLGIFLLVRVDERMPENGTDSGVCKLPEKNSLEQMSSAHVYKFVCVYSVDRPCSRCGLNITFFSVIRL